jgi:membrane protein implicated in regulation of membrane protease activity
LSASAWLIALIVIVVIGFIAICIIWGIRAHRNRIAAGREELVGRTAVVETALEPRGIVLIEGEHWTAIMEKGKAEMDEEVIVTRVEGLKLIVNKKK